MVRLFGCIAVVLLALGYDCRMEARKGKLVICPTPLGNLGDISSRALEALRVADVICCEDTRVTGKLLSALGVPGKRLERMDEATIRLPINRVSGSGGAWPTDDFVTVGEALVGRILDGEIVVYCSDAGMPGVSDPGQLLVALARETGATVEVLPGPTAVATAYVASGFTCPRFYFGGFFPRKATERAKTAEWLKGLDAVALFYESPKRLVACLEALAQVLPLRNAAVCRELSKLHEEVALGTLSELAAQFASREKAGGIKGEIVVAIDAPNAEDDAAEHQSTLEAAAECAEKLRAEGKMTRKDIAAYLVRELGVSRNEAYRLAHES